jgi:hypothetical protein
MTLNMSRRALTLIGLAALTAWACGREVSTGGPPPSPVPGNTDSVIRGVVRERLPGGTIGVLLKGVEVSFRASDGARIAVFTDAQGAYSIVAAAAPAELTFIKDGYSTMKQAPAAPGQIGEIAMPVLLRRIVGKVFEAVAETFPIVGARVEIATGSNAGRSAVTDSHGEYRINDVWGEFELRVAAEGFEERVVPVVVFATQTLVDAQLTAIAGARRVFSGGLCTIAPVLSWSRECKDGAFPYPTQVAHRLDVNRPGTLMLDVTYRYVGDYYANYLTVQVNCGSERIIDKRISLGGDGPPRQLPENSVGPIHVDLPRACAYEIKLFEYIADRKGGDWTTYRLDARYPG